MALAALWVVLQPVASMYSQPTRNSDVVSQAIYGSNVSVLESQAGWARVRTEDGYSGWMPGAALRSGSYAVSGRTVEVASLFAHLYREASVTKHEPLLTVPFETRLELVSTSADWTEVRLVDDRAAWVQRGDLAAEPHKLSIPETIALARRFVGLPYTWGGTSSFGYDCSGFTQMLCRRRGIPLPRDAGPQAQAVARISREELEPGDLLYFGGSPAKITHTGMYIGAGEFIHATAHGQPAVQVSRLDDAHWTARLVACGRPR
jgi:cell wall-associated NlpC family hydrolase